MLETKLFFDMKIPVLSDKSASSQRMKFDIFTLVLNYHLTVTEKKKKNDKF